jgi:hypothetical protein
MRDNDVTVRMDEEDVRFTHDGRIAVEDGMRAAVGSREEAERMMDDLALNLPELFDNCKEYRFGGKSGVLVCDSEDWEAIFLAALARMTGRGSAEANPFT